jgi:hypothetical protein
MNITSWPIRIRSIRYNELGFHQTAIFPAEGRNKCAGGWHMAPPFRFDGGLWTTEWFQKTFSKPRDRKQRDSNNNNEEIKKKKR